VDKRRVSGSEVKQVNLIGGPLEGKVAVIFDDMITTAGTIVGAAQVAMQFGARAVYACATHGVLCGDAIRKLREAPLKQVVITDTIPLTPEKQLPNLHVLSAAPLLADAIKRIHGNESVSALFE
jgi:ribose-phosphate pyrophosphokinase